MFHHYDDGVGRACWGKTCAGDVQIVQVRNVVLTLFFRCHLIQLAKLDLVTNLWPRIPATWENAQFGVPMILGDSQIDIRLFRLHALTLEVPQFLGAQNFNEQHGLSNSSSSATITLDLNIHIQWVGFVCILVFWFVWIKFHCHHLKIPIHLLSSSFGNGFET